MCLFYMNTFDDHVPVSFDNKVPIDPVSLITHLMIQMITEGVFMLWDKVTDHNKEQNATFLGYFV